MNARFRCPACDADWSQGEHSSGCPACGGGAMERQCLVCEGACGATWKRAMLDSADTGEAHWIGSCHWQWWLDEAALPARRWGQLVRIDEGSMIILSEGTLHFSSVHDALAWLAEEEYVPLADALADGRVPAQVIPPH